MSSSTSILFEAILEISFTRKLTAMDLCSELNTPERVKFLQQTVIIPYHSFKHNESLYLLKKYMDES